MARFPSDKMLGMLVGAPVAGLRLWAARKAADRALHAAALRGAADDPYVLARLGLHPLALEYPAHDELAAFGQLLAKTTLGRIGALKDAGALDPQKSTLLAKALAPHAPSAALKYVPEGNRVDGLSCKIAAGQKIEYGGFARDEPSQPAIFPVLAHAAVRDNNYHSARYNLLELFAYGGVSAPLDVSDAPFTLDDFKKRVLLPRTGPKVTIIVPFHNNATTLETAIRSLTEQTWQDLEILAVDDRSSDESAAIANRLAEDDSRIRVLSNARRDGVYGARNTGMEAATGEYVAFLDADDWSHPERIARQMDGLAKGAKISISNHIRMDENGAPVAPRVFPFVRMVPITIVLRTDLLRAAGPFDEVETGADSEMFARLEMLHGKKAVHRDRAVLLVARWREGSLSEAKEGGLFGAERYAYRTEWMFRHAGLEVPALASDPRKPVKAMDD